MSWACPHEYEGGCKIRRTDCRPGADGCVLKGKYKFMDTPQTEGSARLKAHIFQHVPFEGAGYIADWLNDNGSDVSHTGFYGKHSMPDPDSIDLLIVMGGPMNIYEEKKHPWLNNEKRFIESVIKSGRHVLGICLGAQLIADVLGAKVSKNAQREIGWFPVTMTPDARESIFFSEVPDEIHVFHWHEDRFDIPRGARRMASSEACDNQAFEYEGRVIATQFHFEMKKEYVDEWCKGDYLRGKEAFVQPPDEIKKMTDRYVAGSNRCIGAIMDKISRSKAGTVRCP